MYTEKKGGSILNQERSQIGKILRLIRQELFLSQKDLANQMGFSRSRIAEIENSHSDHDLPIESLFRIYYLSNTIKQNKAMNGLILREADKLYDITNALIGEKLEEICLKQK